MNNTRRRFLSGISAATIGGLSSPLIVSSSTNEEYPPVFEGAYRLGNHIRDEYGLPVSVGAQPNDTLILAYRPGTSDTDEHQRVLRVLSEAYASYSQDYPFGRLDGVIDPSETTIAAWLIQPEWTQLDGSELFRRVRETITPYESFSPSQLQVESDADYLQESVRDFGFEGSVVVQWNHELSLYYTSQSNVIELEDSTTLSEEIELIANLYGFMISQGSPIGNLNVRVDGDETVHIGRWFVKRDWAIQFGMAALNEEEYKEKIMETAENYVVEGLPEDY